METPHLQRGAEPRFHQGSTIGCLIVHGFMAHPVEVAWLGDYLAEQAGYTIHVPRLAGHGYDPTHMSRKRWEDWYGSVLDGYHLLRQHCEQIYMIGHSMGGLLGLQLAVNYRLAGLVVAGSPLYEVSPLIRYASLINRFRRYTATEGDDALDQLIRGEQARRGEAVVGRTTYRQWSNSAIHELGRLINDTVDILPQVTTPLLALYALADLTSPAVSVDILLERVQSDITQTYWLERGGHIIFQDVARDEAFAAVADFIAGLRETGSIDLSK